MEHYLSSDESEISRLIVKADVHIFRLHHIISIYLLYQL